MTRAELARWWQEAQEHARPQQAARAVLDYVSQESEADLPALRELLTDQGIDPALHLGILASLVEQGYLAEGDGDDYRLGNKRLKEAGGAHADAEPFRGTGYTTGWGHVLKSRYE